MVPPGKTPPTWEQDSQASVQEYNSWYIEYSRTAYERARKEAKTIVTKAFTLTNSLTEITPQAIHRAPHIIKALRMTSSPTWAKDRLIGISTLQGGEDQNAVRTDTLINALEENRLPRKREGLDEAITRVIDHIKARIDPVLLPWLEPLRDPTDEERDLATNIITERLAQSIADPYIRNQQEKRQVDEIRRWLKERGYQEDHTHGLKHTDMKPGTFHVNLQMEGKLRNGDPKNVPIDVAVKLMDAKDCDLPILIECKSAGDYANVNKRQKEEADKHQNLERAYGDQLKYALYLSGYFGEKFRETEEASGFAIIWHHRPEDLKNLGI